METQAACLQYYECAWLAMETEDGPQHMLGVCQNWEGSDLTGDGEAAYACDVVFPGVPGGRFEIGEEFFKFQKSRNGKVSEKSN